VDCSSEVWLRVLFFAAAAVGAWYISRVPKGNGPGPLQDLEIVIDEKHSSKVDPTDAA
jgi:hypothetical protein